MLPAESRLLSSMNAKSALLGLVELDGDVARVLPRVRDLLVHGPGWADRGPIVAMLPIGPVRLDAWSLLAGADHAMRWSR